MGADHQRRETSMRKSFTASTSALAVLALALTGCSDQASDRRGQGGAPRTTAPSPSSSTATTTSPPSADAISEVCRRVDTAAYNQLLSMALAIGDEKKNDSVLRADAAKTYQRFADHLSLIVPHAQGKLRPALREWATASAAVARHRREEAPGWHRHRLRADGKALGRGTESRREGMRARPSRPRSISAATVKGGCLRGGRVQPCVPGPGGG